MRKIVQLPRSVQNFKMRPNWKREKSGTPCSNDQNLYSAANKTSDGVFQFFWVVDCGRCQNKFINCSWDWSQKNQISFSSSSMYQLFLILQLFITFSIVISKHIRNWKFRLFLMPKIYKENLKFFCLYKASSLRRSKQDIWEIISLSLSNDR